MKSIGILMSLVMVVSCSTATKRLDTKTEFLSDSGELTRQELENAAASLAQKVSGTLKKGEETKYFALLPVRNKTSEIIPLDVFADSLVAGLLKAGLPTIRVEDRERAMQEMEFSQTGLTEKELQSGKMKTPDYFIEAVIDENIFRSDGDRIVEQTIRLEVRSVETQVVVASEKEVFRKMPALQKGGLDW
ncbi:MAG: penicillin-binding protein activator LpoB [Leptospiraceae bacterium]|nr:penicillin-binding protein activator LpoB [Leptospiraceae bacterium]